MRRALAFVYCCFFVLEKWCFPTFLFYDAFLQCYARAAWLLLLSGVTKVNKNTLCRLNRRKHENYRHTPCISFIRYSFLLTVDAETMFYFIGNFQIATICHKGTRVRTTLFKTTFHKLVRYARAIYKECARLLYIRQFKVRLFRHSQTATKCFQKETAVKVVQFKLLQISLCTT